MKKNIVCCLILMSISTVVFSQITQVENKEFETVGEARSMGSLWASLKKMDDTYMIVYFNTKYPHLNEYKYFAFEDIDNALDNLYNIIMKGMNEVPQEDIKLELPNDIVWLHFVKNMGVVSVEFIHSEKDSSIINTSPYLTKKMIGKLFNRR